MLCHRLPAHNGPERDGVHMSRTLDDGAEALPASAEARGSAISAGRETSGRRGPDMGAGEAGGDRAGARPVGLDIYERLWASIEGYRASHGGAMPSRLELGREEWDELWSDAPMIMGRTFVYGVYVVKGNW